MVCCGNSGGGIESTVTYPVAVHSSYTYACTMKQCSWQYACAKKGALFPGPAQLSVTCSMEKRGEPGIFSLFSRDHGVIGKW